MSHPFKGPVTIFGYFVGKNTVKNITFLSNYAFLNILILTQFIFILMSCQ